MLYENQQIGNFNTLIGYQLGLKGYRSPFSINVYQQTPKDKEIGDLFGNLNGRYFIIEFKREQKDYKKELGKLHRVQFLNKLAKNKMLLKLSVQCHFLCHGETVRASFVESQKTYNYLDFTLTPYYSLRAGIPNFWQIDGMEAFVDNIAFGKRRSKQLQVGVSHAEIINYLKLLSESFKNEETNFSGCVSSFSLETGITSIVFESMQDLEKKMKLSYDFSKDIDLDYVKTKELKSRRRLPKQKNKGMGM